MSSTTATSSPSSSAALTPQGSLNINSIGLMVDRWSDIIDGEAKQAIKIQETVIQLLKERNMPEVAITPLIGNTGRIRELFSKVLAPIRAVVGSWKPGTASNFEIYEERPLIVASTTPGIRTAIFIREHGKDLYVSWRTHVEGVINWNLFLVLIILAILPFICGACVTLSIRGFANDFISSNFSSFTNQQQYQYNSPFGGSDQQQTQNSVDVLGGIVNWIQIIGGILVGIIIFFLLEVFLLIWLGYIVHGTPIYYLFIEPTIFDGEDATALSISIDKTLRQAIASVGLDVGKLAPHTIVQSGRKHERMGGR